VWYVGTGARGAGCVSARDAGARDAGGRASLSPRGALLGGHATAAPAPSFFLPGEGYLVFTILRRKLVLLVRLN